MSSLKFSVSRQEALLIMITMFWGGTFLAVQYAVSLSGPLFFVGLRFATAALAVGLLSLRTLRGLTWLEVKAGVAIGVAIALGYGLQTWGLQTISSSKSAFITAMYVPLVPLLQWLCLGRMPGVMSCVGIVLAFIGLILLAGPENNLLALGVGRDDHSGKRGGDRGGDYPYQRLGRKSRCPPGDGGAAGDRVAGGFRRHEAGG
ncbi:Permease of the drug/metabolite transporter (DMT) superfamily [Klebsiella pneumoniae]|nr:Permease of the drug/metabolite transporter (DMT) superfamily [Klebsiella pneumoniae]